MIKDYIGLPYKNKEMDCYSFARLFYKNEFNIELPDYTSSYDLSTNQVQIDKAITVNSERDKWYRKGIPEYGDLLFFKIQGYVRHVGIYIGDNKMIHSYPGRDVCIESLDSLIWENTINHILGWGK